MTKKDGSMQAIAIAYGIFNALAGDEGADEWVMQLLWLADGLNPEIDRHPWYKEMMFAEKETRTVKLRRLIEHPDTSQHEREAAISALNRIREKVGQ